MNTIRDSYWIGRGKGEREGRIGKYYSLGSGLRILDWIGF
jgi:hypothetical protein